MGNHGKLEPQPQAPRGAAKLWSCGRMSDPHFTPPGFSLLFPRFYSYIPPKWVDLRPGGACEALLPAVPAIPG
jgi:hypothetical protein